MATLSLARKRQTPASCLTINQLQLHKIACKKPLNVYVQKIHNDPAQTSRTMYGCFSDPNGDGIGFVLNNANAVAEKLREGALMGSIVRRHCADTSSNHSHHPRTNIHCHVMPLSAQRRS